jgi:hypothetical protein
VAVVGATIAAGWIILLHPEESAAKPKGVGGTISCNCFCDTGPNGMSEITYSRAPVASSGQLDGRTCNRRDPNSGGIRSGKLIACDTTPGSSRAARATPNTPPATMTRQR